MQIFIICSVRGASRYYQRKLEKYVLELEQIGNKVHLPHRDTNQEAKGVDICLQNKKAISEADEIHIFYSPESQGTHFDLGVAFALGKIIKVIANKPYGAGKSFPRMLDEWETGCY